MEPQAVEVELDMMEELDREWKGHVRTRRCEVGGNAEAGPAGC